ncbi:MAG TPA: hypothetical protein HPP77_08785, partial [Candidatus Hydrogenedentes bacterium]|nr:hypothetical protein [Candidatus Hydrogenedentota bacterium]
LRRWWLDGLLVSKAKMTGVHLAHLTINALNTSRGRQLFRGPRRELAVHNRGYASLEQRYQDAVAQHLEAREKRLANRGRAFEFQMEEYLDSVSDLKARIEQDARANSYVIRWPERFLLQQQSKRIQRAGFAPLYLATHGDPSAAPIALGAREADVALDLTMLGNYHDPFAWPGLFTRAARFDRSHLNDSGAALLSRLVAADFVRTIERRR